MPIYLHVPIYPFRHVVGPCPTGNVQVTVPIARKAPLRTHVPSMHGSSILKDKVVYEGYKSNFSTLKSSNLSRPVRRTKTMVNGSVPVALQFFSKLLVMYIPTILLCKRHERYSGYLTCMRRIEPTLSYSPETPQADP